MCIVYLKATEYVDRILKRIYVHFLLYLHNMYIYNIVLKMYLDSIIHNFKTVPVMIQC